MDASNSSDPVRDFNADPTGSVLATTAFLNARDKAQSLNVPFVVPPNKCRIDGIIEFTKMVPIFGYGKRYPVLCETGGKFVFSPPAISTPIGNDDDGTGHILRDFAIRPVTPGTGDHGIEVRIGTGKNFAFWRWSNLFVGAFGAEGLLLDNNANQPNGIFSGSLQDAVIVNGFKALRLGDSNEFVRVRVHGEGKTYISGVTAASNGERESCFSHCSFTTRGGLLEVLDFDGMRVRDSWFELPSYLGSYTGDPNGAAILLNNCIDPTFSGNTYNVEVDNKPAHVIACVGTTQDALISDEYFVNRGWASHVYATASTARIKCAAADNQFNGTAPVIALQGSP